MRNRFSDSTIGKLLLIVILFFNIGSCTINSQNWFSTPMPEDIPLPSYVMGKWYSIEVIKDGKPFDLNYKIIFESDSIVKLIVTDSLITGEGYTFNYKFIDQDTLYVESLRSLPETWVLERKDNNLIIYRSDGDSTITMVLERAN